MVDEDFAWRLAQELVRIDSSDPGAYEDEIERYIKALVEAQLERLSHPVLHAVQVEKLDVLPGRRRAGPKRRAAADLYLPHGYRHLGRWLGRRHRTAWGGCARR